jgi:hypothetical protein
VIEHAVRLVDEADFAWRTFVDELAGEKGSLVVKINGVAGSEAVFRALCSPLTNSSGFLLLPSPDPDLPSLSRLHVKAAVG